MNVMSCAHAGCRLHYRLIPTALMVTLVAAAVSAACAQTPSDILKRVKAAEAGFVDFKADMVFEETNKQTISGMGEGYDDILRLQKASVCFKAPNKIRFDGLAKGIKVTYVQNGYVKLILAAMIRQRKPVKEHPGQRQDSLDLGFLSSQLWVDNKVTALGKDKLGLKLNLKPKFGGPDKRHDNLWIDPAGLRVVKREKYLGGGEMRVRTVFGDYAKLTNTLPIATSSTLYDPQGKLLGKVDYKNLKVNARLTDGLFSLDQR